MSRGSRLDGLSTCEFSLVDLGCRGVSTDGFDERKYHLPYADHCGAGEVREDRDC